MAKVKPLLIPVGMLVLGIVLGMGVGIAIVDTVNTGPWQLEPSFQGYYIMTVADAYANNGDAALAIDRLGYLCERAGVEAAINEARGRFATLPDQSANLDDLTLLLEQYRPSSSEVCQLAPSSSLTARKFLPIVAALAVLGFGGYAGYSIYQERKEEDGGMAGASSMPGKTTPSMPPAGPGTTKPPPGSGTLPSPLVSSTQKPEEKTPPPAFRNPSPLEKAVSPAATTSPPAPASPPAKTDFLSESGEPPIVQFMTTFLEGDDSFDDSFSIETAGSEFLGETGVGISETIGVGEPKRVTAMEVWLFDKNDIRTVTKVIMSAHAFSDDNVRNKLAPKGELALAEKDARITLETASLRIQARVVDLEYGTGPVPPDSSFKRITLELAAWKRS